MHNYQVILESSNNRPAERTEMQALSPSAVFSWAERCAHGRRFEIFEDGASLGTASLSAIANFWILAPASGRTPDDDRAQHDQVLEPLGE